MSSHSIRSELLDAREKLALGRQRLRKQHEQGSPGIQLCAFLTDLIDGVVLDLYEVAREKVKRQVADAAKGDLHGQVALVAIGGYGRRDLAPFSDVDLMLLYTKRSSAQAAILAQQLFRDIGDTGLKLGASYRTPQEACRLAMADPVIFTSLAEARFMGGSVRVFTRFAKQIRQMSRRAYRRLYGAIDQARRKDRLRYGETVYLLQPNVKQSRGGLRDIQLLRWIGFARFGETEPQSLCRAGHISEADRQVIRNAYEFLLRVRNELHFHVGRAQDVLDRGEQTRMAECFGYRGDDNLLPVEQFMSHYFEQTRQVRDVVAHFMACHRPQNSLASFVEPLLSHSMERDYRVGPVHIDVTRRGQEKIAGDLSEVLRLMDLANRTGKRIAHRAWATIRESMAHHEPREVTEATCARFLSLLSESNRLGRLLRRLHELRVLEKLVPGMSHARSLLQFNQYHKYTVDEHCIRTVEQAADFRHREDTLGRAYRKVARKDVLHLAALLHDLGKGHQEDHSELGRQLAVEATEQLGLEEDQGQALQFLVHRHLYMTKEAFERSGSEEEVVRFAVEVGSPEWLRMLFVLTCADLAAVGPGVLNDWKIEVLSTLYRRARDHLTGGAPEEEFQDRIDQRRAEIAALAPEEGQAWYTRQVEQLPPAYLFRLDTDHICQELQHLQKLPASGVEAWARYVPESRVAEYTIGADEGKVSGSFHKLTGALTAQGLEILSAEIHTLADRLVLDRFSVRDGDFNGEPPPERFEEVCRQLEETLTTDSPPVFRQVWRAGSDSAESTEPQLPTRVAFDNETSHRSTVVRIFAHDHHGLLYAISKSLWEKELTVRVARIGTYLDQVVDVFYVVNKQGEKITDLHHQRAIRHHLEEAIAKVQAEEPPIPPA